MGRKEQPSHTQNPLMCLIFRYLYESVIWCYLPALVHMNAAIIAVSVWTVNTENPLFLDADIGRAKPAYCLINIFLCTEEWEIEWE